MRSERLLICLKSYIGDAVMAQPMLDALEREYGRVSIQTSPLIRELLGGDCGQRRYLPNQTDKTPWATIRLALALRKESFGTAVLVNRSFRAALVAKLAGIPVRVGHAREGRSGLLTVRLPYPEDEFEAESCLELARALGCEGTPIPILMANEDELSTGRSLIDGSVVGLQPGARYAKKQLPTTVLESLAKRLTDEGFRIALLGGAEEKADAQRLAATVPNIVDLVGSMPIRSTLGAVSNLRVMVGSDTGLMHVAAAVGTPTVTVFGPTNDAKWGHRYPPHQVLVAPNRDMADVDVDNLYSTVLRSLGR